MKKMTIQKAFIMLFSMMVLFTACEKEGPIGPAGPKGETGAGEQGPKGDQGDNGGFTFKEFLFTNITSPAGVGSASSLNLDFAVTKAEFEKSMAIIYFSIGTNDANWLVMPGIASGGTNTYRMWYAFPNAGASTRAIFQRVNGPGPETWLKARVIVIPLNTVTALTSSGVNVNNYTEVKQALKKLN